MKIKYFIVLIGLVVCLSSCSKKDDNNDPGDPTDTIPPVTWKCDSLKIVIDEELTDNELLDLVQSKTLEYFWSFAEPQSGMARERNTSGNLVTTGGSGFGIMALIAGAERGFIDQDEVLQRMLKICNFLNAADRYHGAWSHWIDGTTGKTMPFSTKDNGGDLIETAFLVQGLISAREYFSGSTVLEDSLRNFIDTLWYGVEWDWYTQDQNVLYWHWSPDYNFEMNHRIQGWNEGLIAYVLAAGSPTHSISRAVYDEGWANNGGIKNGKQFWGIELPLGPDYGGPLFFSHYSFLGLDPRNLEDQYANYLVQNTNHAQIQHTYSIKNAYDFCYYSDTCWGLTASDDPDVGYQAHAPFNIWGIDNGTITPTAALSSFPYTPEESMKALRFFYYYLNDNVWGNYGFKDAFNLEKKWYASSYLAIDQGPIVVMIENYRSELLWNTFMNNRDVQSGLDKLGFTYK
ncbi:hypothetical protein ES705_08561 [subsurface metagenome]